MHLAYAGMVLTIVAASSLRIYVVPHAVCESVCDGELVVADKPASL
jgi:hypothetical protein